MTSGQTNPSFQCDPEKESYTSNTNSFTPSFTSKEDLIKDYGSVELGNLKNTKDPNPDYDPYEHRNVAHPTTNSETLFHLLKGSLGTGILSMPLAFLHAGFVLGVVATIIIGFLCTYCIQMLIKTEYYLCKKRKLPSLTYPALAEMAFEEGPPLFRKCSKAAVHMVNAFLLTYQLGTCCVYTVFIADNIKDVADQYMSPLDVKIYMLMILLPLILINYIKSLKILAPFSTIANFITLFTFGIILYYLIKANITVEGRHGLGNPADFPLFFGTVLFALEAIGVIMPLENEMKSPKSFASPFGVLNIGMFFIVTLYVGMGLLGYLAYGPGTASTITLNIGNSVLAQVAKILLSLAIYITHALQCYVAIDIIWNQYILGKYEKLKYQAFWEYCVRTSLVLLTFCLAIAVPRLELFISLFGALCLAAVGLVIPALIEVAAYWYTLKGTTGYLILAKNCAIIIFGLVGLVAGTYTSLKAIVESFQ